MKKIIVYILALGIIMGLGFTLYKNKNKINTTDNSNNQNTPAENEVDPTAPTLESGVYKNPLLGFSLKLPNNFTVSDFDEGEGHTTLIKGEVLDIKDFSLQIYTSSFDEDISLTIARIKKDIPDIKMTDPIEIKTEGVATVSFISTDRGDKYREIWFIHNSILYQILTKPEYDNITGQIMERWGWSE